MHSVSTISPTIDTEQVVKRIRDLPSMPAVMVALLASTEQDDIDSRVLAGKIALDPALTAKTLRLANSSFYGMPTQVASIQQAVFVLGIHNIRTLVAVCSVIDSFASARESSFKFTQFWRHSIATAVCAKALARQTGQDLDTAFTAGLLYDIGTLVLATHFPVQYEKIMAYRKQHDCHMLDAEHAVFGIGHVLVGSVLAAYWKFPLTIQTALAGHHQYTNQAVTMPPTLAMTIHLANTLAHALNLTGDEGDQAPTISQQAWRAIGLSDEVCNVVFQETEQGFDEMCQILLN